MRPYSLRARLVWFLLAVVVAGAVLQALFAYRTALAEADELFDYQMQQVALSLGSARVIGGGEFRVPEDLDEQFHLNLQIWRADGVLILRSTTRRLLPPIAVLGFSQAQVDGTTYRVFAVATPSGIVQVTQDVAVRKRLAGNLALRTALPIALLAPLLMLLVWWIISRSLAPVDRVRQQVASRQIQDLSPVSEDGLPDEVRPLAHELNLLFARVQQAFEAQRNFVADAAHELRSPLTALKLQVEGLQRASGDESRAQAVARLSAGIDRAAHLVEQLLVLARNEAAQAQMSGQMSGPQRVDLLVLVRQVLGDLMLQARSASIDLGLRTPEATEAGGRGAEASDPDATVIDGYPDALTVMLRNLLDNAIKYTPAGGRVDVALSTEARSVTVHVEDSGPGIAQADRERVFDRFYRAAPDSAPGSGLGLAIVRSVVRLHDAQIRLDRSATLGGLQVSITFLRPT